MNRTRMVLLLAVLFLPWWFRDPARRVPQALPRLWRQLPLQARTSCADGGFRVGRRDQRVEKEFVGAAEAMADDKYNFSPESLKIPGSEYKGVRTFAGQVKHVAISNYFIWTPITGDAVPESLKGDNGGENVKSKADIIKLLKESFALGHKAAAS